MRTVNAPGHVALSLPVVWAGTDWLLRHALPAAAPALVALGLPAELVPPPERAAGLAALGAVLAAVGSVLPDVDYPGHGVRGPRGQVTRGRPALAAATPLTWPPPGRTSSGRCAGASDGITASWKPADGPAGRGFGVPAPRQRF